MRPEDVPTSWAELAAEAILDASFGQELPEAPIDLARAALAAAIPEIQAQALREAAGEMEAEYEERTAKSGAYGQTKIRAALLMGAGMVRNRAARLAPKDIQEN